MDTIWTEADQHAAHREGWDLFNLTDEGRRAPDTRVERLDEAYLWRLPDGTVPPQLEGDIEAWRLIREGVARGSELHLKALSLLPDEERKLVLGEMEAQQ